MAIRSALRRQIHAAWVKTISRHYRKQRINSEASLQASFWSHLNEILEKENPTDRRLFVEPSVRLVEESSSGQSKKERRYPDLVVCSTRQIIAVVELKYTPGMQPRTARDLEKFVWMEEHRDLVGISNERYLGEAVDDTTYKMAKTVLYVWCGVYKSKAGTALSLTLPHKLNRNLHVEHEPTSLSPPDA